MNRLIAVSKVFERILCDQLNEFFEKVLSSFLSAYRKGHNCQQVILRFTEHWRQVLDNGHISGTVAMDLSKVEVFKCVHGFNPTYLNRLFTEPLANYNLRDRRRLNQPRFHTYTYGFRSFRYSGSKPWTSLPRAIKNTNDINEFEKNITEWCQTCDLSKLEII